MNVTIESLTRVAGASPIAGSGPFPKPLERPSPHCLDGDAELPRSGRGPRSVCKKVGDQRRGRGGRAVERGVRGGLMQGTSSPPAVFISISALFAPGHAPAQ